MIISDGPINVPKIFQPGILICMPQESYNKFSDLSRPGGILISDKKFVKTTQPEDPSIFLLNSQCQLHEILSENINNLRPDLMPAAEIAQRLNLTKTEIRRILKSMSQPTFSSLRAVLFISGQGP